MDTKPTIKLTVFIGLSIILLFFGGFVLWSIFAPLDTAAVSQGKIIVDTYRKTIKHLEGGIVKSLNVSEGSKVKAGQILIELDDTQTKANLEIYTGQLNNQLANQARLIAERDHDTTIKWPDRLLKHSNEPSIQNLMKSQEDILKTNQKTLAGEIEILNQKIKQSEKQIESLEAQVQSETEQIKLIKEETVATALMEARKLVPRPQLLSLMREAARLSGNQGEHLGQIAKTQQEIGEARQQILTTQDNYLKEVLKQLDDTEAKIVDSLQRVIAAEDVLKRTRIYAPLNGTVINLRIHTVGGVITAGEPILDLIPKQDQLVIETEINPLDIDMVHPGLYAKVKLVAYKQQNSPTFMGVVKEVSPDIFTHEKTGKDYFIARIVISREELAKYPDIALYPGMPVNVFILTDKRSALRYFIQPIKDSFDRAFKEQ